MKTENTMAPSLLHELGREQLIQMVEELQEEKRMREAFSHISETGSNDAALMWQGRNRFLAENVPPVSIKTVEDKSYPMG